MHTVYPSCGRFLQTLYQSATSFKNLELELLIIEHKLYPQIIQTFLHKKMYLLSFGPAGACF